MTLANKRVISRVITRVISSIYLSPSRTNTKEESEMNTEQTASVSFSVESIPEDLADKSAADDDTTINEESPNDSQSLSTEKQKGGTVCWKDEKQDRLKTVYQVLFCLF